MRHFVGFAVVTLCWLAAALPAAASEGEEGAQGQPVLDWIQGSGEAAPIGDRLAEIDLAPDYVYLDGDETRKFMELTQNPVSGAEMGTVAPAADDESWFVIFEFDDVGYVPDDEKDELDSEAILESVRDSNEAANQERRSRGWSEMRIVGWYEEPHYDERTHNLSWAIIGESDEGRTINRTTKLLGRRGVMTATLVAGPDQMASAVPRTDELLAGYRFQPGSTYAEYVPDTDKLAEYGLTALVVGGVGAALVKSGLLAKFWKPLLVMLVAAGAGIKRFFGGGRSADHDLDKPIT